jgi:hypothetical protein
MTKEQQNILDKLEAIRLLLVKIDAGLEWLELPEEKRKKTDNDL